MSACFLQAKAPQRLRACCTDAQHDPPPFHSLPLPPAGHCRPGYPPHLAASPCNSHDGQSDSTIASKSRYPDHLRDYPSNYPSDYHSSYIFSLDDSHLNGNGGQSHPTFASDSGYHAHPSNCQYRSSYDPTKTHANDTGYALGDGYLQSGYPHSHAYDQSIDYHYDCDGFSHANFDYSTHLHSSDIDYAYPAGPHESGTAAKAWKDIPSSGDSLSNGSRCSVVQQVQHLWLLPEQF